MKDGIIEKDPGIWYICRLQGNKADEFDVMERHNENAKPISREYFYPFAGDGAVCLPRMRRKNRGIIHQAGTYQLQPPGGIGPYTGAGTDIHGLLHKDVSRADDYFCREKPVA